MLRTLKDIIETKSLKNEYIVHYKDGAKRPSDEPPVDFLKRVFYDYMDRPACLDEKGFILLSTFAGEDPIDNIHDENRGDSYYQLSIKAIN
jgi:hypothetical protein